MSEREAWLRGPLPGVPPLLMPAAHALVGAGEDLARAAAGLTPEELWARPAGVASVGFHLRHVAGILDRLLTYARGESLSEAQLVYLRGEPDLVPATDVDTLLGAVHEAIDRALAQLRATPESSLADARGVGRLRYPSTVGGLIFHAAEHAQRHTGQVVTLARIVRGR
jgi:uncharacterized damage-inducible protein DinB